jgi:hypothetical protein
MSHSIQQIVISIAAIALAIAVLLRMGRTRWGRTFRVVWIVFVVLMVLLFLLFRRVEASDADAFSDNGFSVSESQEGFVTVVINGTPLIFSKEANANFQLFNDTLPVGAITLSNAIAHPEAVDEALRAGKNIIVQIDATGRDDDFHRRFPSLHLKISFDIRSCFNDDRLQELRRSHANSGRIERQADYWFMETDQKVAAPRHRYAYLGSDGRQTIPGILCETFNQCKGIRCVKPGVTALFYFNRARVDQSHWREILLHEEDVIGAILQE